MAADGVIIRERLPDETLLVFLSDTHIGGSPASDIFDSAAELTMLLEDLHHHEGPVELVLAGDFLAVAVTAFGLLGWLLYDVLNLGSAELAVAAVALAGLVAIIASSAPMWNQILRYARGR